MKVKISYAVDFDEVPSKMANIINESIEKHSDVIKKLQMCATLLMSVSDAGACNTLLNEVHSLRFVLYQCYIVNRETSF